MKDLEDTAPLTTTKDTTMDFTIISPRPRQPEDCNDSFQVITLTLGLTIQSSCHSVIMPPCHPATLSSCHSVILSPCNILPPCTPVLL